MNILSQILNSETKNLLINEIIKKIKDECIKIMEQILTNFSSHRYIDNTLTIQHNVNNIIKNLIINFIESIDKEYMNSEERKIKYEINKQNVERSIITIYGEIKFTRTLYRDKNNHNYYFFIDDIFNLEQYKRFDPIVRGLTINDSVNNNPNNASYHSSLNSLDILNMLDKHNSPIVSRQSIYQWIRNTTTTTINYDPIITKPTLYIMADEKWIHKQDKTIPNKKKWIMSKCFVVFTGIERKKKRCKLVGKHIFITTSSNPYKELMDEICKIYDFSKVTTINLLSDAGNWILAGASELKLYAHNNIIINTCEFHVKQKINRSTNDNGLREKLSKIIYEDENKEEFIKVMDEIIESKDKQSRKDKITEYKNYIIKHWKGIIAMKYSDIKSSMEAHISHCIASKFGSRPKAYSDKYCQTYLKLQEASLNGICILDYYLKSYNADENFIYNEKEVNFSMFDKSTSNLPCITSSNPISILLNRVAHSTTNF